MLHKHSFIYMAGRVLPALISLGATAAFTRLTDPAQYGILILAMAVAQMGSAAFFQWLRLSYLRLSPTVGSEALLSTLVPMYLLQALFVVALMAAFWVYAGDRFGSPWFWIISGSLLLAQAWFDLNQDLQRAALEPVRFGLTFGLRTISGLGLGVVALLLTQDGLYLALAITVSFILSPIPFVLRHWRHVRISYNPTIMRKVMRYGLPLGIATMLTTAAGTADKIFIALFLDTDSVGAYGAAADLTRQAIFVLLQGISLAAYPLAIRVLETEGEDAACLQLRKNFDILIWLALPACAGFVVLRHEIATLLLGPDFRETAIQMIPWLSAAALLQSMRAFYFDQAAQLGKRSAPQIATALIVFICALAGCYILIPLYGLMGTMYAICATQVIGIIASAFIGRLCFPMPIPWGSLARGVLATAIMATALMIAQPWFESSHNAIALLLLISGGGIIYLIASLGLDIGGIREPVRKFVQKLKSS